MSKEGISTVQSVLDEAITLFAHKDEVYGDTWFEEGILGNYVDVQRKYLRLKNLIEPHLGNVDEKINELSPEQRAEVEDKLLDLINRSAQLLVLARKAWGARP